MFMAGRYLRNLIHAVLSVAVFKSGGMNEFFLLLLQALFKRVVSESAPNHVWIHDQ